MRAKAGSALDQRWSYGIVVIVGLMMVLIASAAADSALHLGGVGFNVDDTGTVTKVANASTKVRKDDIIDLRALSPAARFSLYNADRAGSDVDLSLTRSGTPMHVTTTTLANDAGRDSFHFIGIVVGFIATIGLASLVFLADPRPATLGFYLYAVVMLAKPDHTTVTALPWPYSLAGDIFVQVCYPLAQLLILLFATRIFNVDTRISRTLLRVNAALAVVVFVAWISPIMWQAFLIARLPGSGAWWETITDFLQTSVTIGGLIYVARRAPGPRISVLMVIVGIALPVLNDMTWASLSFIMMFAGQPIRGVLERITDWTDVLQAWFGPIAIAFVCYGLVLSRRVVFRTAAARAAVATIASLGLLALFELIDWAVDKLRESPNHEQHDYSQIIALLVSGFVLRLTHHHVDEFVHNVLFRRRVLDARELRDATEALACTASFETVKHLLVAEPLRVLRLHGGALYLESEHAPGLVRVVHAVGRDGDWPAALASDGVLGARLRAKRRPLQLDAAETRELLAACRVERALALPLLLHGDVAGIVLFADRTDDEGPIDGEELHLLARLTAAGAAAIDHIYAKRAQTLLADAGLVSAAVLVAG